MLFRSRPVITAQPSPITAIAGSTVAFSVIATGDGPLTYQWLLNNVVVSNATNRTLVFANVQPSQAGTYSVQVRGPATSVTSFGAALTVNLTLTANAIGAGSVQLSPAISAYAPGTSVTLQAIPNAGAAFID